MIIKEIIAGSKRIYSSENKYIRKVGTDEIYSEALDVLDYNYEETEREIEKFEEFLEESNEDVV